MEISEQDFFLEELSALRRETWEAIHTDMDGSFSGNWSYGCNDQNPATVLPNSYYHQASSTPLEQDFNFNFNFNFNCNFNGVYCPFGDELSATQLTDSSMNTLDTPPFPIQEDFPLSTMDDELVGNFQNLEMQSSSCKVERIHHESPEIPVFNVGTCLEGKNRSKKMDGRQPSKNLMAERRRRKRLNDRLSMLRSIVPKISKMDRTSILGDTIDYMKELLEKINNLQQEIGEDSNHMETVGICKDVKPSESIVRNTPKFGVERRNMDTRIEICCGGKPGLLLSTVTTLEALGLEIEQCVISCFNDFSVQASCSEETEQRGVISPEDIKQALFRNAGYGGRCL